MSQELINHSDDLKKLQNEGYEIDVNNGYGIVSHIPYLKANGEIDYGILVSKIALVGDKANYDGDHVIYFSGEQPCNIDGTEITPIKHCETNSVFAGINVKRSFSNKPDGNYKDYYEKFVNYANIISFPAIAKDSSVTAKTFKKVVTEENSVFQYVDTNSSRAGIDNCNRKMLNKKIAIIGLGGTGAYILDLVSKTNVNEIHLIDGDTFCQHNAFRSPGAASKEIFPKSMSKVSYFKGKYQNMHKNLIEYDMFIKEENVSTLKDMDFVFICIDSGIARKIITDYLVSEEIPFIDAGMGLQNINDTINGQIRITVFDKTNYDRIPVYLDFDEDGDDVYNTNIQIAECNALNAAIAVMEWKKYFRIYENVNSKCQNVYSIEMGEMVREN
jgi:molybdopterin/thiamine biosynthesis adenylyltransferase